MLVMSLEASQILFILLALLLSMAFHEAMHAFMAHWLGDMTAYDEGRLTLNPLKHIDLLTTILVPLVLILSGLPPIFAAKPVPFNPSRVKFDEFGAALVGLAGPFTNLLLAIAAAGILHIIGFEPASTVRNIFLVFIQVNIAMFVFNMLPIPPLDGSRLLYAFAPEPLQRIMEQIESIGIIGIMIILFMLLPVISPVISTASGAILSFLL
jgi:Zn-dependent protease